MKYPGEANPQRQRAYCSLPADGREKYLMGIECSSGLMKHLKLERGDGWQHCECTKCH